jgi:hypothetical protein
MRCKTRPYRLWWPSQFRLPQSTLVANQFSTVPTWASWQRYIIWRTEVWQPPVYPVCLAFPWTRTTSASISAWRQSRPHSFTRINPSPTVRSLEITRVIHSRDLWNHTNNLIRTTHPVDLSTYLCNAWLRTSGSHCFLFYSVHIINKSTISLQHNRTLRINLYSGHEKGTWDHSKILRIYLGCGAGQWLAKATKLILRRRKQPHVYVSGR